MSMHCIFKMRQVIIMVMFVITGFVFTMQLGCSGALKSNVIESASKSTPSSSGEQDLPTSGNNNNSNNNANNTNNNANNNTNAGKINQNCQVSTSTSGVVTVLHSRSQTFFERNEVVSPSTCQSQVRLCNNGYLSGSYTATNCKVKINSSTGTGLNSDAGNTGSNSNSGSNAGGGTGTIVTTTSTTSTTSTTTSTTLPPSGSIGVGNNPTNPYAHGVVPVVSADSGKWKLASRKASGQMGVLKSNNPHLSSNGRYVVFESSSAALVAGDQNIYPDVYLRDMQTGAITLVSAGSEGRYSSQGNNSSGTPDISADGRWVVFSSTSSNLVPGDNNNERDVFLYDSITQQVSLVSQTKSGAAAKGSSIFPTISDDGRVVVFVSSASNLVGKAEGFSINGDIYSKNLVTGQVEQISVAMNGAMSSASSNSPAVNRDGSVIAFFSSASNLVSNDNNKTADVFVHKSGVNQLVSSDKNGVQGNCYSKNPQLTKAGDKVAFESCANNLVTGDTNGTPDVFLKNIDTGDIQRVSESQSGQQANGRSIVLSISDDGRYVVFSSEATNLNDGEVDTNGKIDIFVKDMKTKQVTRISDANNGIQSNKDSYQADISGDGSTVVFSSDADNLIEGDSNHVTDIFWGY